jgi:VWFA-related protein
VSSRIPRGLPFLIFGALACIASAQNGPLIHVDVREVRVPVFVSDAKGHSVTGLKASDFHIEEDGIPQKITVFTTSTDPAAATELTDSTATATVSTPSPAGSPRQTFVVCVDTLHLEPGNAAGVRDALKRAFEKEKPANAQFTLVAIGRQIQVLQTATSDPPAVAARVASTAFQAGGAGAISFRSELFNLKNSMYDFCHRCPACGSHPGSRACDSEVQALQTSLDAQSQRWAMATGQMLAQLKVVVEELAKLPGGRTLIFISDGFSLRPARDFYAVAAPFLPGEARFRTAGPVNLESQLLDVVRAASNANVRIHSVDSRGVVSSSNAAAGSMDAANPSDWSPPSVIRKTPPANRGGILLSEMDSQASSVAFEAGAGMQQMADATGGIYFHGSNDTLKELRGALADGREYYLLCYIPKNVAVDGKFRAITVEARDPKWHLRAKSGYWAEAEKP